VEVIKDRYSITELSGYLNVTDHTLRYYEREFNLYVPKDKRAGDTTLRSLPILCTRLRP